MNKRPTEGTPHVQPTRLIPVNRWNDYYPWPPIGGLRHLIFHADKNGFEKVVTRVGGRVLLDESEFFVWAKGQGDSK